MTLQTGMITNLNDVLNVLATFLAAHGWTIDGNWLEPVFVRNQIVATPSPPLPAEEWWRYGRRLHAHKGPLYIHAQDFWYTYNFAYGTVNNFGLVGALQGPGIALTVATGVDPVTVAGFPLSHYNSSGPADPNFFTQPGVPVNNVGTPRTTIMPVCNIVSQPLGRWRPAIPGGPNAIMDATDPMSNPGGDPLLPAPFGAPGGAAAPMKYWLLCDAAGDNVIMVVDRSGVDYPEIGNTPYLYFGDMSATKGGAWAGGIYGGASHGCNNVWNIVLNEYHHCTRFAPPGGQRDSGGAPCFLMLDADGYSGWYTLGNHGGNGTGHEFTSTTVLTAKPGDANRDPLGLQDPGILPMTLRYRDTTVAPGPPMLATYWAIRRANGLWSMIGILPEIYQARVKGASLGTVASMPTGTKEAIYFDGFAVVSEIP